MTRRIAVVGTDTGVGKTAVVCALLRALRRTLVTALPFKPAASAAPGEPTDPERLLAAAGLAPDDIDAICPLRYDTPVAPGVAHDVAPFVGHGPPDTRPLERAALAAQTLIQRHAPEILLVEGAGGLHVPMPGGTWLTQWFTTLATHALVVGRAGLGTINHTVLTLRACEAAGLPVLGFVLVNQAPNGNDPSRALNAHMIADATGSRHLATMPYSAQPDDSTDWIPPSLLAALR